MSVPSLENLLRRHMDHIIECMKSQMAQRLVSNYREFLLESQEGQERVPFLVDLMIKAAGGNSEPFFEDQEKIGYDRAIQGVRLDDMCHVFRAFREVCYGVLRNAASGNQVNEQDLMDQVYQVGNVLFEGYVVVARSYMRSREEQINEKVSILQKLHDFAQQIIVTFESEAIVDLVEREISSFFGIQAFMTIFSDRRITGAFGRPEGEMAPELSKLIAKSWTDASSFFANEKGDVVKEVDNFPFKRIVSVPIRTHGRAYGVLALFDAYKSFKFTDKELNLLYQFVYLIGLALENAFMVQEIEQSRRQLRLLTDKMLTIREQERKRLAGDIHDTLAQVLSGIRYKMQFCQELASRMPERVVGELERLTHTVDQAVDQCRDLISSLRPDLIDTLGLVPALHKLFHIYTGATGIKVDADLPKELKSPPEVSICLYRVAQEALTNIHKHADVGIATVKLTERDDNVILVVSDNGKGFDNSSCAPWTANPSKLGLLYTKERVESVGGRLEIKAGMNRGCTMEARIPLNVEVTNHEQDKGHDRR